MDSTLRQLADELSNQLVAYLPHLVAGVTLITVGLLLGWVARWIVVRLAVVLRIDRLFRSMRWGADLTKADVRHTLYRLFGNIALLIVVLLFLNAALNALQLTLLSSIVEKGALFLPRFLVAMAIGAIGWMIAARAGSAVHRALLYEDLPHAALIARCAKGALVLFVVATVLVELDIARYLVLIGFSIVAVTLGAITVLLVARP